MKTILKLICYYIELLRFKFLYLMLLTIAAVVLEGLSVSFILPLLQGTQSDNVLTRFLKTIFEIIGLSFTITNILIFMTVIFFFRSFFLIIQQTYTGKILASTLVRLRQRLAHKIFRIEYEAFLEKPTGYLNNTLAVESRQVVYAFKILSALLVKFFFVILYVIIPIFIIPKTFIVIVLLCLPFVWIARKINILTKTMSEETVEYSAGLQNFLIQSINVFKYLKATGKYRKLLHNIFIQSKELSRLLFKQTFLGAITTYAFEPFIVLILAGLIIFNINVYGISLMTQFFGLLLIYRAMNNVLGTQQHIRQLLSTWGSIDVVDKLMDQLDQSREIDSKTQNTPILIGDAIETYRMSFRYRRGKNVLSNINLRIEPNSIVAIVGDSGSGKSTLVNILIGLLKPTAGDIRLGGHSYEDFSIKEFRKHVGYVTQEDIIFHDTISNNITLWQNLGKNTEREMKQAANKAKIDNFICSTPEKYQTVLGEAGLTISGGQRQRICIARELFKNPKIIVFDEATSALDTKAEKEIQANINELKGEKTILIIAHRLSTVKGCDQVIVLKKGRIVESGSYNQLVRKKGEFRKMVDIQNTSIGKK